METKDEFMKDFITVGELRKMIAHLDDADLITVTEGNAYPNYVISHVEDSTCVGVWELRIRK